MKRYFYTVLLSLFFSQILPAQFVATQGPTKTFNFTYLWARNDTAFVAYEEFLWSTFDGGDSWDKITSLPNEVDPRAIEVARDVLFIGTNNFARTYYSEDWGASWSNVVNASSIWVPTHLASNGEEIFVGGTNFAPHKFDFENKSWIATTLGGTTHALRYLSKDTLICNVGSVVSGHTFISYDQGVNWTEFSDEPSNFTAKTYDFHKTGDRIIACNSVFSSNPYYTDDLGESWIEGADARGNHFAYGRHFATAKNGDVVFNKGNLYVSSDKGETYTNTFNYLGRDFMYWKDNHILAAGFDYSEGGLEVSNIYTVPTSSTKLSSDGSTLYTLVPGNRDHLFSYQNGQWKRDTIIHLNNGFVNGLTDVFYLDDSLFIASTSGLHVANKSGKISRTFTRDIAPSGVSYIAKINGNYYLGANATSSNSGPKIFKSNDKANWTELSFTNSIGKNAEGRSNSIEKIFSFSGVLVADLQGGYAVSDQNGDNWTYYGNANAGEPGNIVGKGSSLIRQKGKVCENCGVNTIEKSDDNGKTWTIFQNGIPGYSGQSDFAGIGNVFDNGNEVLAQVYGDGVRQLVSWNGSLNSWQVVSNSQGQPENDDFFDLINIQGKLFATANNVGVYQLGGSTGIGEPKKLQLAMASPNPIKSNFKISLNESIEFVQILNLQGQLVAAFESQHNYNIESLSAGSYLLLVQTKSNTYSQIIIKN